MSPVSAQGFVKRLLLDAVGHEASATAGFVSTAEVARRRIEASTVRVGVDLMRASASRPLQPRRCLATPELPSAGLGNRGVANVEHASDPLEIDATAPS